MIGRACSRAGRGRARAKSYRTAHTHQQHICIRRACARAHGQTFNTPARVIIAVSGSVCPRARETTTTTHLNGPRRAACDVRLENRTRASTLCKNRKTIIAARFIFNRLKFSSTQNTHTHGRHSRAKHSPIHLRLDLTFIWVACGTRATPQHAHTLTIMIIKTRPRFLFFISISHTHTSAAHARLPIC